MKLRRGLGFPLRNFDVMPRDSRPIGVFDSGIGGLSVLKHLMQTMPHERFVYLGDTARVPYGNRSTETVKSYARQCSAFLLQHDVKLIVVACNTVSAVALDELRKELSVPVIGVIEPAAREAASSTSSRHIGVIGTRATINSEAYTHAIIQHGDLHVHSRACPLLVPLVEEGWLDTAATRAIIEEYLRPLIAQQIDTLVLGCTHYPLLTPVLTDMYPDVRLVDCGQWTAAEAALIVGDHADEQPSIPMVDIYVTDATPTFNLVASRFLGMPVNEPVVVTIDSLPTSVERIS
jgi:glutamate racemase